MLPMTTNLTSALNHANPYQILMSTSSISPYKAKVLVPEFLYFTKSNQP